MAFSELIDNEKHQVLLHFKGPNALPMSELQLPTIKMNKACTFAVTVRNGEVGALIEEKRL